MPESVELTYNGGWRELHGINTKLGILCLLILLLIVTVIMSTLILVDALYATRSHSSKLQVPDPAEVQTAPHTMRGGLDTGSNVEANGS